MSAKTTPACDQDGRKGEVMRMGYLKKLKTMRKKFFILRGESAEASARLEYYDNEKKYRAAQPPKRTISLKTCFNINRRRDTRHKFVIALYTKDDCFCVVLESEAELEEWLKVLLTLQNGEDVVDGEPPRPTFEHVWKVTLQEKGLGDSKNLVGPYHVCLTDQTLSLVKIERVTEEDEDKSETLETLEIPLMYIRSCGVTGSFVYIEVGRQAVTGAGALWMLTEDANIAKNMNSVIFSAFSLKQKDEPVDGHRKRSSSATESSKPALFLQRRQTHGGTKPLLPLGYSAVPVMSSLSQRGPVLQYVSRPPSQRRHSVSAMSSSWSSSVAAHQQRTASPLPCVSHQRTKSCPVTDTPQSPTPQPHPSQHTHTSGAHKSTASVPGTRERSDSMPSRERTTSEGTHPKPPPPGRPHSMHSRGLSYSPPQASGPCSTDSAGSSLSIDDGEVELAVTATSPRYGHSSTPDEPAIIEEILDDCAAWPQTTVDTPSQSLAVAGMQRKVSAPAAFKTGSPLHSYAEMSQVASPCDYMPMSPAYPRSSQPLVGGAVAHSHSRGSSFAEEAHDDYVPMAPNHTDDGYVDMDPLPLSGHGLHGDDGHPSDMSPGSSCSVTSGTPSTDLRFPDYHLDKVSSYFTPSEDDEGSSTGRPARTYSFGSQPETLRPQNHKVEQANLAGEAGRVRAFSVGSKFIRPRNLVKEAHKLPARSHVPTGNKSYSAPLLSSSWSGSSRHASSNLQDPMADLMEIDFTSQKKRSSRFKVTPVMESAPLNLELKGSNYTQITSSADSGYMDMSSKSPSAVYPISLAASPPRILSGSPRNPSTFSKSPPKMNAAFGRSPPSSSSKSPFSPPGCSSSYEPKNSRLTKPAIISSTTLKTIGEKPDIKPQKFPTTSSANLNMYALPNKVYAPGNSSRGSGSLDAGDDYMDMRPKVNTGRRFARANSDKDVCRSTPEGYVEMSWGGSAAKLTRKCSGDNLTGSRARDDYMPMSASKSVCSQPIAIRASGSKGSVTSPASRSNSTSTPPKIPPSYLPCSSNYSGSSGGSSPLSSVRRNTRRKNRRKHERRGSKENVTTPTGSNSAIFPLSLNSPMSPKKSFGKSSADGDTPTNARSPETSPMDELSFHDEDSPYAEMTPGVELEDRPYSEILGTPVEGSETEGAANLSVPLSRVLRISSKGNSSSPHDYANLAPSGVPPQDAPMKAVVSAADDMGDYAVMRPGAASGLTRSAVPLNVNTGGKPAIAQKAGSIARVSSPLLHKSQVSSAGGSKGKDNSDDRVECDPLLQRVRQPMVSGVSRQVSTTSTSSVELAGLRTTETHSGVTRQVSTSSTSSAELNVLRTPETHSGVTRQVSTSSSSSTEVASLKEAAPCARASADAERDITYASLDLAPSGSEGEDSARSPRLSCGSSPALISTPDSFPYAEIDFEKSESLKTAHTFTKKVRH